MRLPVLLGTLLASLAVAAPCPGQPPQLPALSQLEPLPPAPAPTIESAPAAGPPVEYFDLDAWLATNGGPTVPREGWSWQILPDGIIYKAYLANPKESRLSTLIFSEQDDDALWDSTLGGRIGLLRYGTCDAAWPQGWQIDIEGSAQVRLDPDEDLDLRSVDYRIGVPLTYGYGRHRLKLAYYHLCSHLGDEFLLDNLLYPRLNYVRDVLSLGYAYYVTDNVRLYAEMGWGFYTDVSEPWEFLFGAEYAPSQPTGIRGAPFAAIHGHLRQEIDFSGNLVVQAGWAWRGDTSSHLLRTGVHYYNGLSDQYSFYQYFEQQIGFGVWYDF